MKLTILILCVIIFPLTISAQEVKKIDFENDVIGTDSKFFSSLVGTWYIDRDGNSTVYLVDGRKWEQGVLSSGVVEKVKGLYGERYAEFLDNLEAYKYFPLTVCKKYEGFKNGIIAVSFKAVAGKIDQAAGIAFNIKQSGNYLVIRAHPLERNMVLFKMENGKRSPVQWVRNVQVYSNKWYTLKVVIQDKNAKGYLNDKKFIDYTFSEEINGKIGLWSKADSYVFFDNFSVSIYP